MTKAFVMSQDEAVELWNSATGEYFEAQLVDFAAKAINHYNDTIPESVLSDSDARIQDYAEQHMLTLEEAVDALTLEGYLPGAILQAATRDAITPYAYVYEWDYSPGVVHRSFSSAPYNGRRPDRTIQVFKAPKGDGND